MSGEKKLAVHITGSIGAGKTVLLGLIVQMLKPCGYALKCYDNGMPVNAEAFLPERFKFDAGRRVVITTGPEKDAAEVPPASGADRAKAELLEAIAAAANGSGGYVEVYRASLAAWRDGALTDMEADGIGKALLAIERAARNG
jgi:hypothetical protein